MTEYNDEWWKRLNTLKKSSGCSWTEWWEMIHQHHLAGFWITLVGPVDKTSRTPSTEENWKSWAEMNESVFREFYEKDREPHAALFEFCF